MEESVELSFPSDLKLASRLLTTPLAAWGAWVVVGVVHAAAVVGVHVAYLDDNIVSVVAASIIATGSGYFPFEGKMFF